LNTPNLNLARRRNRQSSWWLAAIAFPTMGLVLFIFLVILFCFWLWRVTALRAFRKINNFFDEVYADVDPIYFMDSMEDHDNWLI
jgi:hypothetical protein